MSGPVDIIQSIHNAFRRDMFQIDEAAYKIARSGGDLIPVLDRLRVMNEFLVYHAKGEEDAVFPAMDNVAPLVARAYFLDHRELDTMAEGLEAVKAAPDALAAARGTAALTAHLRIHLHKEDIHMYPILRERTKADEQASIVGQMAKHVPHDRNSHLVRWLFPLIDHDDRAVVLRVWKTLLPPPVFSGLTAIVKESIGGDWAELKRRIPELA